MCSKKAIQQSCKISTFRDWLLSAAAKKVYACFSGHHLNVFLIYFLYFKLHLNQVIRIKLCKRLSLPLQGLPQINGVSQNRL